METKDYILIFISATALTTSVISLVVTLVQKNRETKRAIRKTLSDTLESVSKINIETVKLKTQKENDYYSESSIQLRRNYNSQRRILVAHADFLVQRFDSLATEIDCNLLAGAYTSIGDLDKAEQFWEKTVKKSVSPAIKHMNLRGFGAFLLNNGKEDLGREYFKEAFEQNITLNDHNRAMVIDTYLMLYEIESALNNTKAAESALINATEMSTLILNTHRRNEAANRIMKYQSKTISNPQCDTKVNLS